MDFVLTAILILGAIAFAGWAREGLLESTLNLSAVPITTFLFPFLLP